jgi:quercetin dioxygenase-like cupin family protein
MAQQPLPKSVHEHSSAAPLTRAVLVAADVNRWGEATKPSAVNVWTKISHQDTAGAWSVFESVVPSGLAVPLHFHHYQEEWFWVLDGKFLFEVGGERYHLTSGMSLLAPRKIPHRWKNVAGTVGRLLFLAQPAGRLEEFFEQVALLIPEQLREMTRINTLFAECGMEVVGPPFDDSST